jgi:hypothetical protein
MRPRPSSGSSGDGSALNSRLLLVLLLVLLGEG